MRLLTLVLAFALLALGAHTLARGDEPPAAGASGLDGQVEALQSRCLKLEKQVSYLLSREEATTRYLLRSEARGKGYETMSQRMRTQGFANKAMPPASRETLLDGLVEIGRDMQEDLPAVTRQQGALLNAADRIR